MVSVSWAMIAIPVVILGAALFLATGFVIGAMILRRRREQQD